MAWVTGPYTWTGAQNHAGIPGVLGAPDTENISVWDGNYYALAVTECLGLEASGGMLRVG